MMRYKYIFPTLCIFGTLSLHAEEKGLGSLLQQVGQKKVLPKAVPQKKESKKQTRFIFKDKYDANGIGSKDQDTQKKRSETYDYDNRSRFEFKFNDGSQQSNLVGGSVGGGIGGASGGGGPGNGGGGGRR
jgi:hypothetical protein